MGEREVRARQTFRLWVVRLWCVCTFDILRKAPNDTFLFREHNSREIAAVHCGTSVYKFNAGFLVRNDYDDDDECCYELCITEKQICSTRQSHHGIILCIYFMLTSCWLFLTVMVSPQCSLYLSILLIYQCFHTVLDIIVYRFSSLMFACVCLELRDFEPDDQQEIEVDEGNTAVIECHLPESQPQAQVRYSIKQEWLETSKGTKDFKTSVTFFPLVLSHSYLTLSPVSFHLISRSWFCWNASSFICPLTYQK